MLRFKLATEKTSLYPSPTVRKANEGRAAAAEKLARAAQGKRTELGPRAGPKTLVELEELIVTLVRQGPEEGWLQLSPQSDLRFHIGTAPEHVRGFNASAPMFEHSWFRTGPAVVTRQTKDGFIITEAGVERVATFTEVLELGLAPITLGEAWRRYLGQQLYVLAELMLIGVPNWFIDTSVVFDPAAHKKKMGARRSDITLHCEHFVKSKSRLDTGAARTMAMTYARVANVCDLAWSGDGGRHRLAADVCGLPMPAAHEETTYFMLR